MFLETYFPRRLVLIRNKLEGIDEINENIISLLSKSKNFDILLSKSESVKFSQIESVICLFTNSPVKKYI